MPAISGDTVAAGYADYQVRAFDLSDGSPAWQYELDTLPVAVVARPDSFIVSGPGRTERLSAADGTVVWSLGLGAGYGGELLVTANAAYLGSSEGEVAAFDPESGQLLWSVDPNPASAGAVVGRPGGLEGVLYAAFSDGVVVAIDATSGELIWTRDMGSALSAGPVVRSDGIYVATVDGHAAVLARGDGTVAGQSSIDAAFATDAIDTGSAVLWVASDASAYFTSYGNASVVSSKPGPIGASLAGQPALLGSLVLIPTASGNLQAIGLNSRSVWESALGLELRGGFARMGSVVVAAGSGGVLAGLVFDSDVALAPVFDASRARELPSDGRFRIRNRVAEFSFTASDSGIIEWTIRSEVEDDPVVLSILGDDGRTRAHNMGKVELEDSARAAVESGMEYHVRVERPYPDPLIELTLSSKILE